MAESEGGDEGREQGLLVADDGGMDGVVLEVALAVLARGVERDEEEVDLLAVRALQMVEVAQLLAHISYPRCPQDDDRGFALELGIGQRVAREADFLEGGEFLPHGAEQLGREAHEHRAEEGVVGLRHRERVEQGLHFCVDGIPGLHKVFAEDGYGGLRLDIVVDELLGGKAALAFALTVGGVAELGEEFVLLRALDDRLRKVGGIGNEFYLTTGRGNEEHLGKVGVKQGQYLGRREFALIGKRSAAHTDGINSGIHAPLGVDVEVYLLYVLNSALEGHHVAVVVASHKEGERREEGEDGLFHCKERICSIISRLFAKRGTLCCPPNLPLLFNQSLNKLGRATTISKGWSVRSL